MLLPYIEKTDRDRAHYIKDHFDKDAADPYLHELVEMAKKIAETPSRNRKGAATPAAPLRSRL